MRRGSCEFKRVVLGLDHSASRTGLPFAVELSKLLGLDLCSFFAKEESLIALGGFPFAREFRPLGRGWGPIDVEQLARDLDSAAAAAQRAFFEAAEGLQPSGRFEVVSGALPEALQSVLRGGDVVIVSEPAGPMQPAFSPSLIEAALRSTAAAVTLVPRRLVRRTGPIIAIAAQPADISIDAAGAIAAAAGERLLVLEGPESLAEIRPDSSSEPATARAARLQPLRERLIVAARGIFDEVVLARLVATRQVPILVVQRAAA
jgi:hypothetical protein